MMIGKRISAFLALFLIIPLWAYHPDNLLDNHTYVHIVMPLVAANSYDEALLIYQQSQSDGTSPHDIRVGNCGSATMDIYDDGNLLVRLDYGATSIRGTMIEQEWIWVLYQQGFLGFFTKRRGILALIT